MPYFYYIQDLSVFVCILLGKSLHLKKTKRGFTTGVHYVIIVIGQASQIINFKVG